MEETMRKRKRFAAYPIVKWISLFGIVIFAVLMASGLLVTYYFAGEGVYSGRSEKDLLDYRFATNARMNVNQVIVDLEVGEEAAVVDFLKERNIAALELENTKTGEKFNYWRNESVKNNLPTKYIYTGGKDPGDVLWKLYVDPGFPVTTDSYYRDYQTLTNIFKYRFLGPVLAGLAGILALICLILFFSGIGRVPDSDEVTENYFTKMPFDVLTLILAVPALAIFWIALEGGQTDLEVAAIIIIPVCLFLWLINVAHRIKQGKLFRNTLIAKLCVLVFRGLKALYTNIGLLWKTIVIMAIVSVYELVILILAVLWSGSIESEVVLLLVIGLLFEKIVVYPIILYVVYMTKTLFRGGSELANGNTDYKINVNPLLFEYKKHGENLNNLSDGITKAVEERIKSERMKTELVANVSHDIKTPLTSVINYSDLIHKEAEKLDHSTLAEYSEVLNRQSNRLKKLLEDLVEVSKANTGSMDITMEKLEMGTLLLQIAAEYDDKFREKNLETDFTKPEEELYFMADSRKIWRVFDNLMQNIYKYAYPGTRVYISAESKGEKLCVQFKNTSFEQIDKSPEELLERFTRGDESRHKEGNGLGLAIAKSLTELQGGEMKVEIDGDLFKVIILVDELSEDRNA